MKRNIEDMFGAEDEIVAMLLGSEDIGDGILIVIMGIEL